MEGLRFYKHLAPLEPGGDEMLAVGHYCGYYCWCDPAPWSSASLEVDSIEPAVPMPCPLSY